MAGSPKNKLDTALANESRVPLQTAAALNTFSASQKKVNDVKFISAVTAAGSANVNQGAYQQMLQQYKPSQEAVEFAQSWDAMPQFQRDKWLSENKDIVALKTVTRKSTWAQADNFTKNQAISSVEAATGGKIGWSKSFVDYPDVAMAAAAALNDGRIDRQQMRTLNSAVELVDTLTKIATVTSDKTRQEMFDKLSDPQKMALFGLSDALVADAQAKADQLAAEAETAVGKTKGFIKEKGGALFDATVGNLFDFLLWSSDQMQHVYRAGALGVAKEGIGLGSSPLQNIIEYWDDTATGMIDEQAYTDLKNKYGVKRVDVVREAIQAMNSEETFADLVAKYENDDTALGLIDEILLEESRTVETQDLLRELDISTRDDLGNIVAAPLKDTPFFDVVDKSTNIAAVWFGDPTLIAGKAIRAIKVTKYGLLRNHGTADLTKLLARPEVKRSFEDLVSNVKNYVAEPTIEGRSAIRGTTKKLHGKYLTDDAFDSLERYVRQFRNTDEYSNNIGMFRGWMQESDGFEQLLMGKPVRSADMLVPRMSKVRQDLFYRRLSRKKVIDLREKETAFLTRTIGRANIDPKLFASLDDESQRALLEAQSNNLMQAFEDPTTISLIAERYGVNPDTVKLRDGMPVSGKRIYGNLNWSQDAMSLRFDRWRRKLAKAPSKGRIKIIDGSDSIEVERWARAAFSKEFASIIGEAWRVATPGQRRKMFSGMMLTIAETKGLRNLSPQMADAIENLMTSSMRGGEQYSVTQSRLVDELLPSEVLAEGSARAARATFDKLDDQGKKIVTRINYRIARLIDERKNLRNEIKAMAYDLGLSKNRSKIEIATLDDLDKLKDAVSKGRQDIMDALKRNDEELRNLTSELAGVVDKHKLDGAKEAVTDTKKISGKTFAAINRKIAALERKLLTLSGDEATDLQARIAALKAQRNRLNEENTKAFFESKRLLEARKAYIEGSFVDFSPSEFNGRQHALHRTQLSDTITVPDFEYLQNISVRIGVLNKLLGYTWGSVPTAAVDGWSTGNLIGPRYVYRNAGEDYTGHLLSGGSFMDLMAGKRVATARREALGRTTGIVGEAARKAGDTNDVLAHIFKEHLDEGEIQIAKEALENGTTDPFKNLALKALGRMKLKMLADKIPGIKVGKEAEEALDVWASLPEAQGALDEFAQIGKNLSSGKLDQSVAPVISPREARNSKGKRTVEVGDWKNIKFSDPNGHIYWYKALHSILHRDGRPGQIVFNAMLSGAERGNTIREIRKDVLPRLEEAIAESFDLKQFSAFYEEGTDLATFTRRYFDDSSWYFLNFDGVTPNKELIKILRRENSETGATYGALFLRDENKEIIKSSWVSSMQLRSFKAPDAPEYVLGRDRLVLGEDAKLKMNQIEKAWDVLTDSLARISREPIFFARFIDEYSSLKFMVDDLVETGVELEAAKATVGRLAAKRAEYLALSYMDNPAERTMMAFNVRNVARYYRATEDFYRRVFRLAKYNPESIQKLALSYGILEHSGFVQTDDQGVQYFVYPGTGLLHDAMATGLSILGGGSVHTSSPFALGGETLMLTPSADPNSWLPTFASPIASVPLKILTSIGPFKELESVLLGQRSVQPTRDAASGLEEAAWSIVPGHAMRLLNILVRDERESQYASAVKGAIQILAANGELDVENVDLADIGGYAEEKRAQIGNIALGVLSTRFLLGFVLPASPQIMQDESLSNEAQRLGLRSLRRGFTSLITKFDGDIDRALTAWYKINPNLAPYAVSSTETSRQAYPTLTAEGGEWLKDNIDVVRQYPEAAVFLMPRGGEFSFDTYAAMRAEGFIRGKSIEDMFKQVVTAKNYYEYTTARDMIDKALAEDLPPEKRAAINALWDTTRLAMFANNPLLGRRVSSLDDKSSKAAKSEALAATRAAIKAITGTKAETESSAIIQDMLSAYDMVMPLIEESKQFKDDASIAKRQLLRKTAKQALLDIAGDDPNAKFFFDNILDTLIGE